MKNVRNNISYNMIIDVIFYYHEHILMFIHIHFKKVVMDLITYLDQTFLINMEKQHATYSNYVLCNNRKYLFI